MPIPATSDRSQATDRLAASLFAEVLIAEQLSRNLISKALPRGMQISHFSVLNLLAHLNVERTPAELAETLRETVAGGEYASTSEVVREALREWTRRRDVERQDLEALRAAIRAGLDSGPALPADQVFAELRARYAAKS